MQANGIQVSRGAAKAFQSQVIESFNRTFKLALKQKIVAQIKLKNGEIIDPRKIGIFKERKLTRQITAELVKQTIEEYNNKEHSKLQGMTPNQMEEAFFFKHQNQDPKGYIMGQNSADSLMITKTGNLEDAFANAYRGQVIAEYKGDWLRFFLDWKREQEEQGKQVLDTIVRSKEEVINKLEEKAEKEKEKAEGLSKRYESLYDKFLEVQSNCLSHAEIFGILRNADF